jgi:signal transduction histidine kinase
MQRKASLMKRIKSLIKATQDTTSRRLRSTPGYFFLIWRWSMWLYALIIIATSPTNPYYTINCILLVVTLIQTLVGTLYAPVFQFLLPTFPRLNLFRSRRKQALAEDEDPDILTPLVGTPNRYWNIAIYTLDVIICGVVTYLGGPFGTAPNFGSSSPFYRYGLSTAFAAALTYRYPGGLAAALGYDLFIVLGAIFPPFGSTYPHPGSIVTDVAGSLVDAPIAALLAAFVATLLASYTQTKHRDQANVRLQKAMRAVGETILRVANDQQQLLHKSAEQIRSGGRFQRVIVALVASSTEDENNEQPKIDTCIVAESDLSANLLPTRDDTPLAEVLRTQNKLLTFEPLATTEKLNYSIARLYLPFFKDGQVQMILGAESRRQKPFELRQEDFLRTVGSQLLIALDNIRLTEQTIQLVASAERGRMAREIHDGIAQLLYMLSLNAETCAAQIQRIAEASDEDRELLAPLAQQLDRQITISKQALWETRNYMFSLRPLMIGTTTLTQMLTNQLREFEAISGLSVRLEVEGTEIRPEGDKRRESKQAQVGAAIFRIVQEALTNAYKHAEASEMKVHLRYTPDGIEVVISDNGRGLEQSNYSYTLSTGGERQRFYSGHGINGMRERASELGGTLDITQMPAGGVQVQAWIPIASR